MKNFQILSAIKSDAWLIHPEWVQGNSELVYNLLSGKAPLAEKSIKQQEKDGDLALAEFAAIPGTTRIGYWRNYDDVSPGSIGVLSIEGPITKYGGWCSYGVVDWIEMINKAAAHPNISGIIVCFDTPGGQVSGTSSLADAIKAVKKPVLGYVDDGLMASAGVWLGVHTEEIWASQKTDIIGSIGVYTQLADWMKFYEEQGLPVHEIYSDRSTEKNKEYREAMKKNYAGVKEHLNFIADEFISKVKENRANISDDGKVFKGKIYYAEEAIEIGLIDNIGSFQDVVARMNEMVQERNGSGSDNLNANNQSIIKSEMGIFSSDKHKQTQATFKKALNGEKITEQELDDMNAELKESGVALQVASQEEISATNAALAKGKQDAKIVSDVSALFGEEAKEEDCNLNAAVKGLQTDKANLKSKVAELGEKPGEQPSAGASKKDKIDSENEDDFTSEADAEAAKMRKEAGYAN